MSYKQMMKWNRRHPTGGKPQYMGFSTLAKNERRRRPWLGGSWFEPGMESEREKFIRQWEIDTARMLQENPDLVIVG